MSINVTDKEKAIEIVKKFNKENRYRDCGRINNAIDMLIYVAENSMPKEVIIDKIEEIEEKMKYEDNEKMLIYLHKQRKVLRELLKGEK